MMNTPAIKTLPKAELNKLVATQRGNARYHWERLKVGQYIEWPDDLGIGEYGRCGATKMSKRRMAMYKSIHSWNNRNGKNWEFVIEVSPDNPNMIRAVRVK